MDASMQRQEFLAWTPRWHIVASRFLWKEFRMLRGFWIGVAGIAILEMIAARWLSSPGNLPTIMFASAWGAAALYAVGAAVTLFSAEREEGTDEFLRLLPRRHGAMFTGKISAAMLSAASLAGVMSAAGWAMADYQWPDEATAAMIAAVGSVGVLEALAWGVLASLLCPQPLLAAILAIAAASLGVQFAISLMPSAHLGLQWSDYYAAVPWRLAMVAVIGLLDVRLGWVWLRVRAPGLSSRTWSKSLPRSSSITATEINEAHATPSRRRLFIRLLWQSWREGWAAMLLATATGVFLVVTEHLVTASIDQSRNHALLLPVTLLAIPALLGAMTFRADQRRRQYHFLAHHAASPRIVWAARQAAWLLPVMAVTAATTAILMLIGVTVELERVLDRASDPWQTDLQLRYVIGEQSAYVASLDKSLPEWLSGITARTWCAVFAASALGQLASMLIRREVMAGFVAVLASVVLVVWSYVLAAWDLSPAWFLLPVGLAALVATWRRAPDWIVDRNGWRAWAPPMAIAVAGIIATGAYLPAARIAQVDRPADPPYTRPSLADTLAAWHREKPASRATARRYERLLAEFAEADPEELPRLFEELADLSKSPRCWFTYPNLPEAVEFSTSPGMQLQEIVRNSLLAEVEQGNLDDASERILLLARLQAHRLQYQTTAVARRFTGAHDAFGAADSWNRNLLLDFAVAPGQQSDRLVRLAEELRQITNLYPTASDAIVAEYLEIRQIIRGLQPSVAANAQSALSREWLALVANELPWERRRAEIALRQITEAELEFAAVISAALMPTSGSDSRQPWPGHGYGSHFDLVRQRLYPLYFNAQFYGGGRITDRGPQSLMLATDRQRRVLAAAQTSYLVTLEKEHRSALAEVVAFWLRQKTMQNADILRLGLVAYRLDHGEYPEQLAALVPRYLPRLPADPLGGGTFEYRREGFSLPVRGRYSMIEIPANTPLVWSPGLGSAQPEEKTLALDAEGYPARSEEPGDAAEFRRIFQFRSPTDPFGLTDMLLFPLPEVGDADSSNEGSD